MSTVTDIPRTEFRPMTADDLADVVQIEHEVYRFAWTEQEIRAHLDEPDCTGELILCNGHPVGFMLWRESTDEAYLVNFALLKPWRRRSIGRWALERLVAFMPATKLTLHVRISNVAAVCFYLRFGFRVIQVIPQYWRPNGEDAYEMALRVTPSTLIELPIASGRVGQPG